MHSVLKVTKSVTWLIISFTPFFLIVESIFWQKTWCDLLRWEKVAANAICELVVLFLSSKMGVLRYATRHLVVVWVGCLRYSLVKLINFTIHLQLTHVSHHGSIIEVLAVLGHEVGVRNTPSAVYLKIIHYLLVILLLIPTENF